MDEFCCVQNMDVELLKLRSRYMRYLLSNESSHSIIMSSYPEVPRPQSDLNLHFEPDLYYSCIHWLANNGCQCHLNLVHNYSWQDIIHVANFLASDYLFLIALRQITIRNCLEMLECFESYLRPSSWAWQAIQIRISIFLGRLTPKMLPVHFHILQNFVRNKNTNHFLFLQKGMFRTIRLQFQNEYRNGSSRNFVAEMVRIFAQDDPLMEQLKRCILYFYGVPPDWVISTVWYDVSVTQNRRSGVDLAIESLAAKINKHKFVQCCACHESYVPTRPMPASLTPRPSQRATVFMTCCLTFIHQGCFQKLLGSKGASCPRCTINLPNFPISLEPSSYLQIFLTSARNRTTAHIVQIGHPWPVPTFLL
eukprot:GHVU01168344.1.p1 GENE.GHVU01168344.1~~GHVU01168344.1.p1  ORF type:complete len:365 (+),score=-7.29 GHVU01168344.1:753-1847(+)